MAKYLLDTTMHIHWSRGVHSARQWIREAILNDDELSTSVVCVSEAYAGAHIAEIMEWSWYFDGLDVLPVTHNYAVVAGRLRYNLAREGKQLHLADSLIAATALETGGTVVTANRKDFELVRRLSVIEVRPERR